MPAVREINKALYPNLTHHLTGRYHTLADYREQITKWAKPGDTVVLLLLVSEKESVPADFRYLLPKPWSEMEADANRKGAARYDGESHGMHVIALVGKNEAELMDLTRMIRW